MTSSELTWNGTPPDHMYEYEWNSNTTMWDSVGIVMDMATGATGWMTSGAGRNDDTVRLYAPSFVSGIIYEITAANPNYIGNTNSTTSLDLNPVSINIYPIPASDKVTVKLGSSKDAPVSLSVLNLIGEILYEKTEMTSNESISLNTSTYAAGVYLVKVKSETGESLKKIVIE